MNTNEYINIFHENLNHLGFESPRSYDPKNFESLISNFYIKNSDFFKSCGIDVIPKPDALKKLWNKFYLDGKGRIHREWDSNYVRSEYFHIVDGCEFIYYPSKNPKRLILNFSSMGKNRFDRYSRYWDPSESWDSDAAYIFFKDDTFCYFLGTEENPKESTYFRIVRDFVNICSLRNEQVYTVGGSMGGYAAIFYALSLELGGAIVAAPQIDKRSMVAHKYNNWTKNSNQTGGNWRDLNVYSYAFEKLPYLYIEYGKYPSDVLAAEGLIEVYKNKKSICICRKSSWSEHTVSQVLSKDLVDSVIDFFEKNRRFDEIY